MNQLVSDPNYINCQLLDLKMHRFGLQNDRFASSGAFNRCTVANTLGPKVPLMNIYVIWRVSI